MAIQKRSFFERLTGAVRLDEEGDSPASFTSEKKSREKDSSRSIMDNDPAEAELTVDVYETPTDIVIRTMVAGVRPEDLDISITRDMVVIRGERQTERTVTDEDYFHRELFWGAFARSIVLPKEIEVEEAEATERHGLLTIRLPKIDKNKQTKLKVR